MILLLFFCSGATALVYEVVWSKYLSLMFGSTIYAQTVVLAVFMGGLALGNLLIGKRADLLKAPLSGYGRLEVIIGLYAFCFSWIYQAADQLFVTVGSRLLDHSGWLLLLKAALSVALLLLPTVLMGGTLPLLCAWLQRQSNDAGRWSARFYSTNSLGAVAGAWFAGFILVRTMGMVSTLQMTALANVIIGLTAIGISRRELSHSSATPGKTEHSVTGKTSKLPLWVTVLVALTGGVSMGLEILASRSLTLIFGASLQAFAIVLMAFILGIGLGSAAVASPHLKRWQSENLIIILLLMAAGIVGALVLGIEQWVEMYRYVLTGLGRTPIGYRFYQLIAAAFSLVILGVPAGLIGAILPLAIRLVAREADDLGNRVGRLLTWNTVGAVVGVLLTGFILMPTAGVRNAFNLLAICLCVAVAVFAWNIRRIAFVAASSALAVALILSCAMGGTGWRYVLSSGIFRNRELQVDLDAMAKRKATVKLLFYEDAPDATVSVEEFPSEGGVPELGLRISGKPEASSHGDLSTQLLLGHLPMLARPGGKDVFCFGLGSGITASAVLLHPIDSLTIGENCAPVLRAARFFNPWNGGVLTNALTRIRLEDARTILKLSPQKYDAIISEPSNPWFASIGSVYSREFYSLAAARLKPGGIMVQWFHLYEMHDGIANLVFRTFQSVFPFIEIWDTNGGDIILLGSDRPWSCSLATLRQGYSRDLVRQDLERIGLGAPDRLLARQLASQRTAFAIAGDGPVQSDVFPVLEYAAPEAFFIGDSASRIERFDERTWQSLLAAHEKRTALMNLDDDKLRAAFKSLSMNTELRQIVATRLERAPGDPPAVQGDPVTAIPCVFKMLATNASKEHFPPKTSEELKQLYRARAALQRDAADWTEQVQIVRRILAAQLVPGNTNSIGKIGAHFAGVAARACMAHSDLGLSEEMLNLGMKFLPDERELSYLSRVLQRRRTEQSGSFRPGSSGIESAGTAAPRVDSSLRGAR